LNSLIMLRVVNADTAQKLTDRLEEVRIATRLVASGVSDTNDPADFAEFATRNEDRVSMEKVPMLDPAWLMKLPKGQAYALLEGGRLSKVRIPLPLPHLDASIPANWSTMLDHMRNEYAAYVARAPHMDLTVEGTGGGF
jgi:hypothetical protein